MVAQVSSELGFLDLYFCRNLLHETAKVVFITKTA